MFSWKPDVLAVSLNNGNISINYRSKLAYIDSSRVSRRARSEPQLWMVNCAKFKRCVISQLGGAININTSSRARGASSGSTYVGGTLERSMLGNGSGPLLTDAPLCFLFLSPSPEAFPGVRRRRRRLINTCRTKSKGRKTATV